MFYVQEGVGAVYIKETGEDKDFKHLSLIKKFNTYKEAESFVFSLINEKHQNYYTRMIMGKRYIGFDYGSWSHFYFITSDEDLKYEELYDLED